MFSELEENNNNVRKKNITMKVHFHDDEYDDDRSQKEKKIQRKEKVF